MATRVAPARTHQFDSAISLLDYAHTALDTFEERPVSEADSLIFSQLVKVHAEEMVPELPAQPTHPRWHQRLVARLRGLAALSRAPSFTGLLRAESYEHMLASVGVPETRELLHAVAASPRFRDVRVVYQREVFTEEPPEQFGAVAFVYKSLFAYVAFRGTDTSLAGWRENFLMGYSTPVPGQADAVRYLEEVAGLLAMPLIVGGHSKGGNLAVYAAAHCCAPVQQRIAAVYNHDGPGFRPEALDDRRMAAIADRVHKTVPEESLVGVVLDESDAFEVIRSAGHGPDQHGMFMWEIDPTTGNLVRADGLADSSRLWQHSLASWLNARTPQQIEQVAQALFAALEGTGSGDVGALLDGSPQSLELLTESVGSLSNEQRELLGDTLRDLGETAAHAWGAGMVSSVQQWAHGVASGVSSVANALWELATGTEEEKARAREIKESRSNRKR